jgi:uncharacterized membrane protein YwzB
MARWIMVILLILLGASLSNTIKSYLTFLPNY